MSPMEFVVQQCLIAAGGMDKKWDKPSIGDINKARILEIVKQSPSTANSIAIATGFSKHTTTLHLRALVLDGEIEAECLSAKKRQLTYRVTE